MNVKKNINIEIDPTTRMVYFDDNFLGIKGENLQGKIIFSFRDNFVDGTPSLAIYKDDTEYIITELEKVDETYQLEIKSSLLTSNIILMQLIIIEEGTDSIPKFKSNIFKMYVGNTIESTNELTDDYVTLQDQVVELMEQMETVNKNIENLVLKDEEIEENITNITSTNENLSSDIETLKTKVKELENIDYLVLE